MLYGTYSNYYTSPAHVAVDEIGYFQGKNISKIHPQET
jgi:hypothetical protein